ncbi:GspH/FimT family pseudopilin [Luminiphilus syltensis]|nr:GspH/FimT family pseudopilin [Luminiphilus syltensis]
MPRASQGFSLLELMVVIIVVAILLAIAAPSFTRFFESNRLSTAANSLLYHLQLSRSEAVRYATDVTFCPSADGAACSGGTDWTVGWIVTRPDPANPALTDVLRVAPAVQGTVAITGGPTSIVFSPVGSASSANTFTVTVGSSSDTVCVYVGGMAATGSGCP